MNIGHSYYHTKSNYKLYYLSFGLCRFNYQNHGICYHSLGMNTDVVLFMRNVWPFLASFLWNCALSLFVCLVSGEKYDPTWLLFLCCHANITIELFLMSEICLWWVAMGDPLGSFCCSPRIISLKASQILLFVSYFFSPGISRWSSSAVLLLPPIKENDPGMALCTPTRQILHEIY